MYTWQASAAQQRLMEAKDLGAEELATYEYYSAKAYLEKAATEAAESDFGDAVDLAERSEQYSSRAIELSRDARRGVALP